jgi:hypothetical protein
VQGFYGLSSHDVAVPEGRTYIMHKATETSMAGRVESKEAMRLVYELSWDTGSSDRFIHDGMGSVTRD